MTAQNRATLKAEFLTGSKPTAANFANLIDSAFNIVDPTAQVIVSPVTFDSAITLASSLSVSGSSAFGTITVPTKSYPSNTTDAASTAYVTTAIANAGVGTGTVSSVTFTGDGTILSSTPSSAVTSTGTVTATLKTQNANIVLAGPTSGGAGAVTYRSLVNADLPATAVTPNTYTNATITVNQQGLITAASTGSSASGLTLLNTVNANTAASVVFNSTYITSTYNKYIIEFDGAFVSVADSTLLFTISTNNGVSYVGTGYVQITANNSVATGSPTANFNMANTNNGLDSAATVVSQGTIKFSNPSSSKMFNIEWSILRNEQSSRASISYDVQAGINTGTTAINAIKIVPSGGTLTGNFHLYGISGT